MKRTQFKDLLRNIWKQKVSFLSILVIAGMGLTTFLSIDYTAAGLKKNGSDHYNAVNYRDIEAVSSLMFAEGDLDEIRAVEGVKDVEAVRETPAKTLFNEQKMAVHVSTLTERINQSMIHEGRLPETVEECAVDKGIAETLGVKVGDTLEVEDANGLGANYLTRTTFKVVGIVSHPDHISIVATEDPYVLVLWDVFDESVLKGAFMKAEIVIEKDPAPNRFSKKYDETVKAVQERIEALGVTASERRNKEVYVVAYTELEAGEKKLADAKKKLEEGRALLDEKTAELKAGEEKLETAEKLLAENLPTLEDGRIQLEAGKLKLDEARAEIESGKAQLAAAKAELDKGKAELDSGKAQLESGYAQLESAKARIRNIIKQAYQLAFHDDSAHPLVIWADVQTPDVDNASETARYLWITDSLRIDLGRPLEDVFRAMVYSENTSELLLASLYSVTEGQEPPKNADGSYNMTVVREALVTRASNMAPQYKQLSDACEQWDQGHDRYIAGRNQYLAGLAQYEAGEAQLKDGETQYKAGLETFETLEKQYLASREKYDAGMAEVEEGRKQLEEGRALIADGEKEYADGLEKYKAGELELENARAQVAKLDPCRWIVLDPHGSASFAQIGVGSDSISNLKTTFSLLFVFVGALVVFATVGKIVDEQRTLVGTTKALGFYTREIFTKYAAFGVLATLLGGILAIVVARFAIAPFLLDGFGKYYYNDMKKPTLQVLSSVIAVVAAVLLALFAVWLACSRLLKEPAIRLMAPKAPAVKKGMATGKKKGSSLYSRLILLNMKSDLKRVLVTIVSVAGSAALIIVGLTLRSSVEAATTRQYEKIYQHDLIVSFDSGSTGKAEKEIEQILKDAGTEYEPIIRTNASYRFNDLQVAILTVGDLDRIEGFAAMDDWKTGKPLFATNEGVLIQQRLAEIYGLEVGSEMEFNLGGTRTGKVRIAGIFTNYIGNNVAMSKAYYESVFRLKYQANAFFVRLNGADRNALVEKLKNVEGFENWRASDEDRSVVESSTSMMNTVVLIFIFIAALMAFAVQLNLTNMYVLQKKRELTIMRINGFTVKEVILYMLRETFLTTALGIVLGLALGSLLGNAVTRTLEQTFIRFGRDVYPISWLVAAVMTVGFTVIVNYIALRKVKNLKLTDVA